MRKNAIFTAISLNLMLLSTGWGYAQDVVWAHTYDNSSYLETENAPIMTLDGDVVLKYALFSDSMDLDPGANVSMVTADAGAVVALQKLDAQGNLIWFWHSPEDAYLYGHTFRLDHEGNVYVSGSFTDTIDLDPGSGPHILIPPSGETEGRFLLKVNHLGSLEWAKAYAYFNSSPKLDVSNDGKAVVYDAFYDSIDIDPGVSHIIYPGPSYYPYINSVAHYLIVTDDQGAFEWGAVIDWFNGMGWHSECFDPYGNVFVSGQFKDSLWIIPTASGDTHTFHESGVATYLAKFDTNGVLLWCKTLPTGSGYLDLQIHSSDNRIYLSGSGTPNIDIDFGAGQVNLSSSVGPHPFIAAYDLDANYLTHVEMEAYPSVKFSDQNIYMLYLDDVTIDIDPGANTVTVPPYQKTLVTYNPDILYQSHTKVGPSDGHHVNLKFDTDGERAFFACSYGDSVSFELDRSFHVPNQSVDSMASVILWMDLTVPAAIDEVLPPNSSLFPNPSKEGFRVQGGYNAIRMFTLTGRLVGSFGQEKFYRTDGLPKGVYFVELSNGKMEKLVIAED